MIALENKIRTYSKNELAGLYGINVKTLMGWLRKKKELRHLSNDNKKLFSPAEVRLIFSDETGLGKPD